MLLGCAPNVQDIIPAKISANLYNHKDCDALLIELLDLNNTIERLSIIQTKAHKNDKVFVGVGIIFPLLIFAGSYTTGKKKEDEISVAMGKKKTLEKIILINNCQ